MNLLPKEFEIKFTSDTDEKVYTFTTFSFSKTVRILKLLTEILQIEEILELIRAENRDAAIKELIAKISNTIESCEPVVRQICGLVIMRNSEIKLFEKEGQMKQKMFEYGDEVVNAENGLELIINVIVTGIDAIGFDTIKKELPRLMGTIQQITR